MRRTGIVLVIVIIAGFAQADPLLPNITMQSGTVPGAGYLHSDLRAYAYSRVAEMDIGDAESIRGAVDDINDHADGDTHNMANGLRQASNLSVLVRRAAAYGVSTNESSFGVRTNLNLARGANGLGEGAVALLTDLGRPPTNLEAIQLRQEAATVSPTLAKSASLMIWASIDARHYVNQALAGVDSADRDIVDANMATLATIHRRMEFTPSAGGLELQFSSDDQAVIDAAARVSSSIDQEALVHAADVLVQAIDEISTLNLPALPPGPQSAPACGSGTFYFTTPNCEIILADGGVNQYQKLQQPGGNLDDINVVLLDFGGNDKYPHRAGGGTRGNVVQVNLDFGGDDVYERLTSVGAAHGAGVDGVGVLYDKAGSDRYFVRNAFSSTANHLTQGAGERGVGVLIDVTGSDTYTTEYWGSLGGHYGIAQGAGLESGVGILNDKSGSDDYTYSIFTQPGREFTNGGAAQAFGSGGAGVLVDAGEGNDDYLAGQDMVQAAASLGGFAFLTDGGGTNTFTATSVKGCARMDGIDCLLVVPEQYEWIAGWSQSYADTNGIAMLHTGQGSDRYQYAPHEATPAAAEGVNLQGAGNTSGVAVLFDLGGVDTYTARAFSQAYASAGVAVVTDVSGDDTYACSDLTCIGYASEGGVAVWCDLSSPGDSFADGNARTTPFARANIGIGARNTC